MNRSRAGGGGRGDGGGGESRDGYESGRYEADRYPAEGYEAERYEAERYEDRADYRDLDAQYAADGYDDGAAYAAPYEGGDYAGSGYAAEYTDEYAEDYDDQYDQALDDDAEELMLTNRVFTIPNLISLARLAGVPLFLGLILSPYYGGPKYDTWALLLLALSGFSDWLDGKLARRWNQMSKVGAMLDPLADRLYIIATLVGMTMRDIIPLWLPVVLIGRDLALLTLVPKLRRAGYGSTLPVHFLGKAATFNLLYAFPLLLLGQIGEGHKALMDLGNIFGWAFVGWGTALYLLAGGMYFVQTRRLTRGTAAR